MAWNLVTTWVIRILCHSLILLSDAVSLKRECKHMVCFTADQIEEVDLTRIADENATVSSSASSDEEVCFGDT
jgi:hypothetical protein